MRRQGRKVEKLCFRFSGCDPTEEQTQVPEEPFGESFNDLGFYRSLLNQEGCVSVEIASVRVRHNSYCHGIQAFYRVRFADGKPERLCPGPEHFSSHGYYSYHG